MICADLAGVGMAQPGKVLFENVSLTIASGDRVALVGINGSGKSTLLRIIAGTQPPDVGEVRFGRGVRIATLEQDPQLPAGTVGDYLGSGWEVESVATSLGIGDLFDRSTTELSGGQAKRAALAKALVGDRDDAPDMIVLDEPTNHLDLQAIDWLERRLAASKAALVLVTHDRHLMDRLTTARGDGRVIEVSDGTIHQYTAVAGSSAYATYLAGRESRAEHRAAEEATRRILARRELEWLQRGAQARSTKPKARLRSAREIVAGGPADANVRTGELALSTGMRRLGNQAIELRDVAQTYGDEPVFSGVDLIVEPGARLGIVGPNGAGKSTLLDILAQRRSPSAGEVKVGSTVKVGYADQQVASLEPEAVVRNLVAGPHRQPDWQDRQLLEQFWFDSTAQYAPVRMLSGGERRRLQLVMVLAEQPNVLVLDEPTNDLDLDTLRALEGFLDEWPGALIVASHDRTFLDRTVDHVLAIAADGSVRRVPGGVQGWLAEQSAPIPAGATATAPPKKRSPAPQRAEVSGPSQYTIGRQLRETEISVKRAQSRVDKLTAELASTNDHVALADISVQLEQAHGELARLEDQWIALAELHDGP